MGHLVDPVTRVHTDVEILHRIAGRGTALVALSGGVDSSLVAALAFEALGPRSVAVTLAGPAVARSEVERARQVARSIGIDTRRARGEPPLTCRVSGEHPQPLLLLPVSGDRGSPPGGKRSGDRPIPGRGPRRRPHGRPSGSPGDGRGWVRPSPGLGRMDQAVGAEGRARATSPQLGPAFGCMPLLSGRPRQSRLRRTARADRIGRGIDRRSGFRRVRVRTRGQGARIEVDPDDVARLSAEPLVSEVRRALGGLGFDPVEIDAFGYRGSAAGGRAAQ